MTESSWERSLALTLRHSFGDLLDFPLLQPTPSPTGQLSATPSPAAELSRYAEKIRFCDRCSLHIGRRQLVFGRGHWGARLSFVGDFPSLADDQSGEPFSGEEGALLSKMILAMKVRPEEAYLTNLYKCRPPAGERPGHEHFAACQPHLVHQFSLVNAPVLVALGEEASRALARSESPLQVLRKQVFEWQGRKVIPTHHPRDLLLSPALKKEAWDDLQAAMRELERLS